MLLPLLNSTATQVQYELRLKHPLPSIARLTDKKQEEKRKRGGGIFPVSIPIDHVMPSRTVISDDVTNILVERNL